MQVTAQQLIAGLISRGVPLPAAQGFVANFIAESGLDPGINEIAPLVPGSRGGFGLPQFTGPRRRAFEAFAQRRGVDPSDVDAQLDFIVQELNTTESAARDPIFNAQTAEQAALEVSRRFLRPGIPMESVRIREARRLAGLPVDEPDPPRASTMNGLLRPADVTNGAVTRAEGERNMQQGLLGQPVQPQQSSGLRDVLRGLLTPDGIATLGTSLALAANAARFRPDPGITASLTRVQEQRRADARERQQNNRTAEFLRQRGRNDLADAVESGAIPANVAARAALDTGTDSVVVGNALVDRQTGRVIFRNESATPLTGIAKARADLQAGLITQEEFDRLVQPDSGFRVLSEAEKRQLGLDPNLPLQVGPDGRISQIGGGGTTVTVNNGGLPVQPIGTEGNVLVRDPTSEAGVRFVQAPGSPAARKLEEERRSAEQSQRAQSESEQNRANIVSTTISNLRRLLDRSGPFDILPEVGIVGNAISGINQEAADVRANLDTLKGIVAFDRLQKLKEASANGASGLGQVAIREIELLQSQLGALDQRASKDLILQTLKTIEDVFGKLSPEAQAFLLGETDTLLGVTNGPTDSQQPPKRFRFNPQTNTLEPVE